MLSAHTVVCGVAGLQAFFYCMLSVLMCKHRVLHRGQPRA